MKKAIQRQGRITLGESLLVGHLPAPLPTPTAMRVIVQSVVFVVAGILIFGTPMRGSPVLLAGMTFLFLVGALGLGIFISAAVKSQVLATQVAMLATYLPAVLLSGFLYDIASMPPALKAITYLIPARYFVTVTRGIFLKGVGWDILWPQFAALFSWGVAVILLAAARTRKQS